MGRNDKNILKAAAIFVVALIVFIGMNYYHTVVHNSIIKHSTQKQVDKYKEDSCSYYIVRDIDGDTHILFWQH